MEIKVLIAALMFFILTYLLKAKHTEGMVINKKKNRNRKKELKRLQVQEEKLERELERLNEKIKEKKTADLTKDKYECARKLNQAREEIETLEERIV